jgi:O-antigen ligase
MFWAVTPKVLSTYCKVIAIMLAGWFWSNSYNKFNLYKHEQIQTTIFAAALLLAIFLVIFAISLKFGWQLHAIIDERVSQALVHGCIACSLAIWMNLQHFKKWAQVAILIILFWAIQRCSSDTAALGILLGSGTLIMHTVLPRFLRAMFIYGMPIVWSILPFIFRILTPEQYSQWSTILDPSHTHRLFIWHSVTKQLFERFWTGFGIGSSRYRFLTYDGGDITIVNGHEKLVLFSPENCLHPHNFMLQIWLELGAIGVALACLTWIIFWRNYYETSSSNTIAFFGCALCVAATGISVWQSWWLILLVVLVPVYKTQYQSQP